MSKFIKNDFIQMTLGKGNGLWVLLTEPAHKPR